MILFDIETGPLPGEEIAGQFDPDSVKLGNLKDQEKIDAKIESAREAFIERAALSPLTGRVLAIGWMDDDGTTAIHDIGDDGPEGAEAYLIAKFWSTVASRKSSIAGFNIFGFDLPFLARRAWLLGVDVPAAARNGRYWSNQFVDLLDIWQLGNRMDFVGLDAIDRALGGSGKPEGTTGADFSRLFFGTKKERKKAIEYLKNDLEMTARVAEALQIL